MTHDLDLGRNSKQWGCRSPSKTDVKGSRERIFPGSATKRLSKDGCLHISEVVHQARVEVTEEGTKAAAATAVIMTATVCFSRLPPPRATFKADHPFLFLIRDRDNGSILFLGRLTKPEG